MVNKNSIACLTLMEFKFFINSFGHDLDFAVLIVGVGHCTGMVLG